MMSNYSVLLGLDFRKLRIDGTSRPDGAREPKVFAQWRRSSEAPAGDGSIHWLVVSFVSFTFCPPPTPKQF